MDKETAELVEQSETMATRGIAASWVIPAPLSQLCSKVRELDARVGTLTDLLEQVRDLDSLSDLSDLMPDIIKAVGENPAHHR